MDRKIRCPVCHAAVPIVDENPEATHRCPYCKTTFVLPPKQREAEVGDEDDEPPQSRR